MKCGICGEEGHNRLNKKHKPHLPPRRKAISFGTVLGQMLGTMLYACYENYRNNINAEKAEKYDRIKEVVEDDGERS